MLSHDEMKLADYKYCSTDWKNECIREDAIRIENRFRLGLNRYVGLISDEVNSGRAKGRYSVETQIISFGKYVRFRIGVMHKNDYTSWQAVGYDSKDSEDYEQLAFYTLKKFAETNNNEAMKEINARVNKKIQISNLKGEWNG